VVTYPPQLTTVQEFRLSRYLYRWRRLLLSPRPVNQKLVETQLAMVYRSVGKPAPHFIWGKSPLSLILTYCTLTTRQPPFINHIATRSTAENLKHYGGTSIPTTVTKSVEKTAKKALKNNFADSPLALHH